MNKYTVRGDYTISFETEVYAESETEAIEKADDINFWESCNNGIFADYEGDQNVILNANSWVDNVEAELIEENVSIEEDVDDESDCDE